MKNINETMSKYTAGEITLEQTNEKLAPAESGGTAEAWRISTPSPLRPGPLASNTEGIMTEIIVARWLRLMFRKIVSLLNSMNSTLVNPTLMARIYNFKY